MRRHGVQRSEAWGRGVGRWRHRHHLESMQIHRPHENGKAAFSDFSTLRPVFKKCIFWHCVYKIRMDGWPKQCNTCVFSQKSVFVWTAPHTQQNSTKNGTSDVSYKVIVTEGAPPHIKLRWENNKSRRLDKSRWVETVDKFLSSFVAS